jgi:cytochrome bd-type quinol oxidase subunit 2
MKNLLADYGVTKPLGDVKPLPNSYDPGTDINTATQTFTDIFSNAFGVFTLVAGLMFILYFILGGISWITSGGERDKIEKAKQQMTNAVIGLIIMVAAYGIAFIVGKVLGINILDPSEYILNYLKPAGVNAPAP